jgi:hypothetical protein
MTRRTLFAEERAIVEVDITIACSLSYPIPEIVWETTAELSRVTRFGTDLVERNKLRKHATFSSRQSIM